MEIKNIRVLILGVFQSTKHIFRSDLNICYNDWLIHKKYESLLSGQTKSNTQVGFEKRTES